MDVLNNKEIGRLLKTYRKTNNLTQFQLAETVEIDEKQLGKIERGVHYPSVPTFLKLVKELNIDINRFYKDSQNSFEENSLISKIEKLSQRDAKLVAEIIEVFLRQ